jgi:hypothetical protein
MYFFLPLPVADASSKDGSELLRVTAYACRAVEEKEEEEKRRETRLK